MLFGFLFLMRLITLNVWGGKLFEELCAFVVKYRDSTDIFCFQEVFDNAKEARPVMQGSRLTIFSDLAAFLPDFEGCSAIPQDNHFGTAIFVRRTYSFSEHKAPFVHQFKNSLAGNDASTLPIQLQHVTLTQIPVTIFNFHGLWNPKGKIDIPERLRQSQKVCEVMNAISNHKIICGDFNLLPDTKSLFLLEQGMRNLVKEYGFTSTRTSHYKKPDKFADYVLVSAEIRVLDFKVLAEEVSDHAALLLDFEI